MFSDSICIICTRSWNENCAVFYPIRELYKIVREYQVDIMPVIWVKTASWWLVMVAVGAPCCWTMLCSGGAPQSAATTTGQSGAAAASPGPGLSPHTWFVTPCHQARSHSTTQCCQHSLTFRTFEPAEHLDIYVDTNYHHLSAFWFSQNLTCTFATSMSFGVLSGQWLDHE